MNRLHRADARTSALRTTVRLLILWLALLGSPAGSVVAQTKVDKSGSLSRFALVIGNSDYQSIAPLANPVNDARAIAARLEGMGYQTTLLTDTPYAQLKNDIDEFARGSAAAEAVFVFYAGHGFQIRESNHIVPIDFEFSDLEKTEFRTISLDTILSRLSGSLKVRVLVLDACRDNPTDASQKSIAANIRSLNQGRSVRVAERGFATMQAPPGTFIAFSTAAGTTASDGKGSPNSPFAKALINHLATPSLELTTLFNRVRKDVLEETTGSGAPQLPWTSSSLLEEFYVYEPADKRLLARQVQERLIAMQCLAGPADGTWGTKSRDGIRAFNSAASTDLDPNGLDPNLLRVLAYHSDRGLRCAINVRQTPSTASSRPQQPLPRATSPPPSRSPPARATTPPWGGGAGGGVGSW